jgi:3',5'-nucleoside bisphosphate phosphatase
LKKDFRADLHVHTVLSPCAEIEMLPPLIVQEALDLGIQIIAITDHNASANIAAVQQAALGTDLAVLPGMELQTQEEIHVLCLFDTLEQVAELQKTVDQRLPPMRNDPEHFGVQLIVDSAGTLLAEEDRLLLTSVGISISEAYHLVTRLGGLFVPAHINRKAYGLIEVLGFVPDDLPIEALEISRHIKPAEVPSKFPQIIGYPLLQNGDVHRLDEFLGVNHFHMAAPTIHEIQLAIHTQEGRSLSVLA